MSPSTKADSQPTRSAADPGATPSKLKFAAGPITAALALLVGSIVFAWIGPAQILRLDPDAAMRDPHQPEAAQAAPPPGAGPPAALAQTPSAGAPPAVPPTAGTPPAPSPPAAAPPGSSAQAPLPEKAQEGKKHKDPAAKAKREVDADLADRDELFSKQDYLPSLAFDFVAQEWEYIHKDPRRFAEATMTADGGSRIWKAAALKLTGNASFRGPDDRPETSVCMSLYKSAERWHGFLNWRLKNEVQDNSFLNEQIACEIARMAGVPAPRCAHAVVRWQNRELGLYVFTEAFDRDFLSAFFKNPDGDLYDPVTQREIGPDMAKDQGDRTKLDNVKELIAACQDGDQKKRWARLEKILDIEAYLTFLATEVLVCHNDGYNFNRSNYHLYFDADTGKASFFMEGAEQTFGNADYSILSDPGAMVGQAVMSNPDWKQAYRERVERLYNEVLLKVDWPARVEEVGGKVKTALAARNPQWAKDFEPRIKEAHDRVSNRIAGIAKQLAVLPHAVRFDDKGSAPINGSGWLREGKPAATDTPELEGKPCFHITASGETAASWRKRISLAPGKYRLSCRVRSQGLEPMAANVGAGGGLRVSGGTRIGQNSVTGDTPWQEIAFLFDAPGDVTVAAELRASKGEIWFDQDSFRIEKVVMSAVGAAD